MHCSNYIIVFIYLHVCLANPTSRLSMTLFPLWSRHSVLPVHWTSKASIASDICYYFCLEHFLHVWLFTSHRSLLKYHLLRGPLAYHPSEVVYFHCFSLILSCIILLSQHLPLCLNLLYFIIIFNGNSLNWAGVCDGEKYGRGTRTQNLICTKLLLYC